MLTQSVIAHLVVKGGVAAIDFYKAALGAIELERHPSEDGRILHAALQIGSSCVYLSDDFPEYCGGSRAPQGETPVTLHLNVPNCDAAMQQAHTAGATVTMPAADMFWGARYGQLTDPFGHRWSFSHPLTTGQTEPAKEGCAAA